MGNMTDFAKSELDRIGLGNNDRTGEDIDFHMRDHILRMIEEFEKEGHSGFSASYALGLLERLLAFKPLTPLTGEDDEWMDVYEEDDGDVVYQNKRMSSVFKSTKSGAYDIDGIVFYDWCTNDDGAKFKSYYTCYESRLPIEFPYTVPDKPIYKERESEAE